MPSRSVGRIRRNCGGRRQQFSCNCKGLQQVLREEATVSQASSKGMLSKEGAEQGPILSRPIMDSRGLVEPQHLIRSLHSLLSREARKAGTMLPFLGAITDRMGAGRLREARHRTPKNFARAAKKAVTRQPIARAGDTPTETKPTRG